MNATTAPAVIELVNVTKTYQGPHSTHRVHALRNTTLRIRSGELLAIEGPSGCGKSTLLHILGTLDGPTDGRVILHGNDIAELSDRELSAQRAQHIGFVFQRFFLLDSLTALDNVATGLLYRRVPMPERRSRAEAALNHVGLGDRITHRPRELSGGEQQRVAIARAIIGEPDLILADEPTGNLDSTAGQAILQILRQLNRTGTAIAIVTHDHTIADTLPRRITLRDGAITTDTSTP